MSIENLVNRVHEGDVLEALSSIPDDLVDVTVTSPPYNKRNRSQGWLVTNKKYSHFDDHMPEESYQAWQIQVLDEIYRITKPGGSLFYNHKHRWVDGLLIQPFAWLSRSQWTIRQEIVWDRAIAANMRGWRFWQVDERIYWLYKPKGPSLVGEELASRHAKCSSIWRFKPTPRMEDHPAPFPLELPTRAIYSVAADQGAVVLDPFCGTGTTLVAAKLLGHHYVGIDISPTYAEFARQRLLNAEEERPVLEQEIGRHFVEDPFAARKQRGTVTWPYGPRPTTGNGNVD